jgi:hypothetical protein
LMKSDFKIEDLKTGFWRDKRKGLYRIKSV